MTSRLGWGLTLLLTVFIAGCSPPPLGGPRHNTSPVFGIVHVDGQPAELAEIECHAEPGTSKVNYPVATTTDKDGKFKFALYEAGDGLPAGTYHLAFKWLEPGLVLKDKLKGAYADPKKSQHTVTIKGDPGEKHDLGVIELSTKGPS